MNIFNFTFHIEATEVPLQIINEAKKYFPSVGISIKPKTDVNLLTPEILKLIDLVLVMSVEPGFGGQSFIESSIEKVSYFSQKKKEKNFHYQIQVDGGVSSLNSKILIDAGADNLVAGSYIFKKGPDQYLSKISSLLPTH